MTITIFATHKGTKERLVFCQALNLEMAQEIIGMASKIAWDYEIHTEPYTPKRLGQEGKDGRWV